MRAIGIDVGRDFCEVAIAPGRSGALGEGGSPLSPRRSRRSAARWQQTTR